MDETPLDEEPISDEAWGREFARHLALEAEADRAEEERIADLARQLADARAARARRHRERRVKTSFTLTPSVVEMLRAEAKRRGLTRSKTVSALIEAAHRGESIS